MPEKKTMARDQPGRRLPSGCRRRAGRGWSCRFRLTQKGRQKLPCGSPRPPVGRPLAGHWSKRAPQRPLTKPYLARHTAALVTAVPSACSEPLGRQRARRAPRAGARRRTRPHAPGLADHRNNGCVAV